MNSWRKTLREQWKERTGYRIQTSVRHIPHISGMWSKMTEEQREKFQKTIDHFHDLCAYCQERPYKEIDHFIPYVRGGSKKSLKNLVPSCAECNDVKADRLPKECFHLFPAERLDSIASWLEQQ